MRRIAGLLLVAALFGGGLGACAGGGDSYKVTAFFPSAISLYTDSQIRVLGLRAGRVTSVKVEGTQVRVTMSIPDHIPLPANVSATIIPLSFIGERYVQLFPAWKEGEAKLAPNSVIPLERTSVPVEPDETLAALKHLLDSIDPTATGKLITNLADGLDGTGDDLNRALSGLGTITETLGAKDKQVASIIDHFDRLTATLATRDQTLGRVLDAFAKTTDALADERASIQSLLESLASIANDGLDLVSKHRVKLDKDLTVLSRTLRLVNAHIDQLDKILAAAPVLTAGIDLDGKSGLAAAYSRELHALDLRAVATPNVAQAFQALGLPSSIANCVPVTVSCQVPGTQLVVPGGLPYLKPLPASRAVEPASAAKEPTPEAARAANDAKRGPAKKPGGLSGFLRSISAVFG